jgi:hypothetical protein
MLKNRLWIASLAIFILLVSVAVVSAAHLNRSNAQPAADPTCSSSTPCIEYQNTGTGQGLEGVAKSKAGLWGVSTSSDGVYGVSTSGTGVAGTSTSGVGVGGTTSTGTGVKASASGSGTALNVASGSGTAINVTTGSGEGLLVEGPGTATIEAQFLNTTGSAGEVAIGGSDGLGLEAFGIASSSSTVPAIEAVCVGAPAVTAFNLAHSTNLMSLDCSGNMILAGTLTTKGTPLVARRTAVGNEVATFSAQQTTQTMEDLGEAQLVGGQAYVRLASDFAATTDERTNYLVFITPQGESRGLYVAHKSAAGFEVRENANGTSSLAFDYRIVAKPYGEASQRLPVVRSQMGPDPTNGALIQRLFERRHS